MKTKLGIPVVPNPWLEWAENQEHVARAKPPKPELLKLPGLEVPQEEVYPERIKTMWLIYGKDLARKCNSCVHCVAHAQSKTWYKCDLTLMTNGEGTDWRVNWPACGKWEQGDV